MGSTFTRQSGESISHQTRTFFDPSYMGPKQGPPKPPKPVYPQRQQDNWNRYLHKTRSGPLTSQGNYWSAYNN